MPSILTEKQAEQLLREGVVYSTQWRSSNSTSTELLFLQLLSYYVDKFPTAKVTVSIQTRMPVLKPERELFNRKLYCAGVAIYSAVREMNDVCFSLRVRSDLFQSKVVVHDESDALDELLRTHAE